MKFINALFVGKSLDNPEFWKDIQSLLNLISGCIPIIIIAVPSVRSWLTVENITALGSSVAAMNIYFTNASSDKVGI
jgi:ribosomal protein L5